MDNKELLQAISDMMDKKLEPINGRLDKMENQLHKIENRLDKMESQVSASRVGQIELRKEIKEVNIKVSETYQLALDAWGTSTENRNWLESL